MRKRFQEIEKEQFNQNIPIDLVERLRYLANHWGWSLSRTTTYYLARGIQVDPAKYGIDTDKQTA